MPFRVRITNNKFSASQVLKLNQASAFLEEAFNSDEFKQFVLGHEVEGEKGFHYTDDTNEKIFERLMSGSETLDPDDDHEADIFIEIDNSYSWNVIGYTYPNTKWQWVYARFFNGSTVSGIVGNLAHEWCHKMGYDHEFKWTALRELSVPYAVGYFMERYAEKAGGMSYFQRFKAYFS